MASGALIVLAVLKCMRHAAERAKAAQRKADALLRQECDVAYDRGYYHGIADYKRKLNRTAAEQFADTFENRNAKFQMREGCK